MKFSKSINKRTDTQKNCIPAKRAQKKLNYNFSSSKTHLLVYWIWERGNEFSLWERKKNSRRRFKNEHAHIFPVVSNVQYAMSRKNGSKKNCEDWKYAELINFPFISSTPSLSSSSASSWMCFDSMWCGLIWHDFCLICAIQSFARNGIDQLD